jgi:hypothetical protein
MTPSLNGREHTLTCLHRGIIPVLLKKNYVSSQLSREELIAAGEDPDDPAVICCHGSE